MNETIIAHKYNYSLDKKYQNFDRFFAVINL